MINLLKPPKELQRGFKDKKRLVDIHAHPDMLVDLRGA